ncbi:peptidase, T1 family, partial [Opisthorchis viverrini]
MAGENCVAIASDLRFGVQLQTISTDFPKVHQLGPRLFVGFAGLMTDNETVYACEQSRLQFRKNVYELRENKSIRPKTLATILANLLYERRFGSYFVEPVVAGLDHITGTPYIASTDNIGCISEPEDFVVAGTSTEQLYGMCETLWQKKMKPAELFECISQCILNAVDRDCLAGWGARVYL